MDKHIILGVHIHNRGENAVRVQQVLTEYGCHIKTRLGLHEANENLCSEEGVLVLQLTGDRDEMKKLEKALNELESVKAKMVMID